MASVTGKQRVAEVSRQPSRRADRAGRADGVPCAGDAPAFKFLTFDFAQNGFLAPHLNNCKEILFSCTPALTLC